MEIPEEANPPIPEKVPDSEKSIYADISSQKEESTLFYKWIKAKRQSELKGHAHRIAIFALYLFAGLYAFALFTWFYHLLLPVSLHYMPDESNEILKNLLLGTIVGGFLRQLVIQAFKD